ncbi:MAG: hypothetical protein EOP35_05120 [Rubrivivax sp.]|nr:MAG: hypothetical protein EOP35_05120 [Rubrivivax sp.]
MPRLFAASEACNELQADDVPPIGRPPIAFLLAPFFDRWPRFAVLVCVISLLVLFGLAGDPPDDTPASQQGEGFPAELRPVDEAPAP